MSETVNIRFEGDASALLKAYDEVEQENRRLKQSIKESGEESERFGILSIASFDLAEAGARAMSAAWSGIKTVIGEAIREQEHFLELQKEAAEVGADVGQASREAKLMFSPDATIGADAFDATVLSIAKATTADAGAVYQAFASGSSAKGELPNSAVRDAITLAAAINPGNAGFIDSFSSGTLDIMKAAGTQNPEEALGYILNLTQASRVTDATQVMNNLKPAAIGLMSYGNTLEQGGELLATMTQLKNDVTGATSATAVGTLAARLSMFEGGDATFGTATSTMGQLEAMWANPAMQDAFIASAAFPIESKTQMEALVRGTPQARAALAAAQGTMSDVGPGQAALTRDLMGRLDSGTFDSIRGNRLAIQSDIQLSQLTDLEGQLMGQVDSIVRETFDRVDVVGADWLTDPVNYRTGWDGSPRSAAHMLRSQVQNNQVSRPQDIAFQTQQAERLEGIAGQVDSIRQQQTQLLQQIAGNTARAAEQPPEPPVAVRRDRDHEG